MHLLVVFFYYLFTCNKYNILVNNWLIIVGLLPLSPSPSSRFITIWWQRRDDSDNQIEPFFLRILVPHSVAYLLIYMALCCLGRSSTVKEFTILLIHVLHVSHPAALEGSMRYAREIVGGFLRNILILMLVILSPVIENFVT